MSSSSIKTSKKIKPSTYFKKKIKLVSIHKKELAIAPYFKKILGANLTAEKKINTDKFGTFSGEIDRAHSPLETARLKLDEFFKKNPNQKLAIASEGSFFPHPEFIFATLNEELLVFQDREQEIEVIVKHYSTKTNMASAEVSSLLEIKEFASKIGFPKHALILKIQHDKSKIYKGITSKTDLIRIFTKLKKQFPDAKIALETDMRACYNPTRMKQIGLAGKSLAKQLKSNCPKCSTVGFGIKTFKKGLPCENCGTPTQLTLSHIYQCQKCNFEKEKHFPDIKKTAFAGYCLNCNP